MSPVAPVLVFGWGNPSRGDDALGPLCVARLRTAFGADTRVEWLEDFQLQPEHALDLAGRQRVLFVDASRTAAPPCELGPVWPARDSSISSHALSPQALLQVYGQVQGTAPPPCSLLAIRGDRFDLGEPPAAAAEEHLEAAVARARQWLDRALEDLTPAGPGVGQDLS